MALFCRTGQEANARLALAQYSGLSQYQLRQNENFGCFAEVL